MAEEKQMVTCQLIKVVTCRPVVTLGANGQPNIEYVEMHDPKAPLNFILVPGTKDNVDEKKPTGKIYIQQSNSESNVNNVHCNSEINVNSGIPEEKSAENTKVFAVPSVFSNPICTIPNKLVNGLADGKHVKLDYTPIELIKTEVAPLPKELTPLDDPYTCKICNKSFSQRCYVEVHLRSHTGERPCRCELCGKSFSSGSGLWSHKKTHETEKPFLCDVCGKTFLTKGSLETHMRSHRNEKAFTCSICDKSYITGSSLSLHKKTHFIKGPLYTCELCGRSFKLRGRYRRHVRIHEGDKRFHCSFCDKKFINGAQLKKHTRTHTGERPYKCEFCEKTFSSREGVRLHRRQHTNEKPYSCPKCPKTFKSHSNMRTHVRSHFGIKPYSCKLCKRRFTQTHSLKKHIADKVCLKEKGEDD